jgi:acetylornithine deacetylase/succinyl-diaminopimelate desuccinylase-like protein
VNVIAGAASLSLDVRSPRDAVRLAAVAALRENFAAIAARRGCRLGWETLHDAPAVPCHPAVVAALEATLTRLGQTVRHLPSGAGHDAMAMAALCPSGMLFLRCRGGVSHNPAESISAADAGLGVRALIEALHELDRISWSDHARSN